MKGVSQISEMENLELDQYIFIGRIYIYRIYLTLIIDKEYWSDDRSRTINSTI